MTCRTARNAATGGSSCALHRLCARIAPAGTGGSKQSYRFLDEEPFFEPDFLAGFSISFL